MDFPFSNLGTPLQAATAIFSGGILATLLGFAIKWRGQSLNSDEQIRQLMAEALAEERKTHAAEVDRLTKKLDAKDEQFIRIERHWREMLEASDKRHDECEDARRELRGELDKMHSEIRGLRTQVLEKAKDAVLLLDANGDERAKRAPESVKAAKRLDESGNGGK